MELAGWAVSEARAAGRDQIYLQTHRRTTVDILKLRPRHLDDIASCLMLYDARSRRMPAIARRTAPRSAQPPSLELSLSLIPM